MSALSLRLPNSLHERARDLARREGVSINQLVASALADRMSALLTEERDRVPSAFDMRLQPRLKRRR